VKTFTIAIFQKKRLYFSILLLGAVLYGGQMTEMRRDDQTFINLLSHNPFQYEATVHYYQVGERSMRYVEIGDDELPLVVFIHGAPSSSSFWEGLLRDSMLLSRAKLLAVDRPGYGYSGFGLPEISVKKQAACIAELLREKRAEHETIILHGSSYGGTVTARLAMDYPELVDGILLQSASLMPGEETTYWISYPTHHWLLRWLMPGPIRVANAEKLSHEAQLRAMAPLWERIRSAAIVLHGTADRLIFPENAEYARQRLINTPYLEVALIEGKRHDLLWSARERLVQSLLKLIRMKKGASRLGPALLN
jgi:pimeloyl-ACP methyl ester carboxylesterase